MANGPLVLVPIPPKWEGAQGRCGLVVCRKEFIRGEQIVVLRYKNGCTCAFCSAECMNAAASRLGVEKIGACELWTYFPTMGKGALFGVRRRTKRERARDRRLKKGIRRHRK